MYRLCRECVIVRGVWSVVWCTLIVSGRLCVGAPVRRRFVSTYASPSPSIVTRSFSSVVSVSLSLLFSCVIDVVWCREVCGVDQ